MNSAFRPHGLRRREFKNDYKAKLHRRAMRYGKTVSGALAWLDRNYTGNSKDCFRYQANAASFKVVAEMELRRFYLDALKSERSRCSKLALKLALKVKEASARRGPIYKAIEVEPKIYRTYAGRHQKAAGAFVFYMKIKDSPHVIGSYDTAIECSRYEIEVSNDSHTGELIMDIITEKKRG